MGLLALVLPWALPLLLLARRLGGSLVVPAGAPASLLSIALTLGLAILARRILGDAPRWSSVVVSLGTLQLLPALIVIGASPVWLVLAGVGIAAEAFFAMRPRRRSTKPPTDKPALVGGWRQHAELVQTYGTDAGSRRWVRIDWRTDAPSGHKARLLHVGFCPPFESRPVVECPQTNPPGAAVRVIRVLPYGMVLELRAVPGSSRESCGAFIVTVMARAAEGKPEFATL